MRTLTTTYGPLPCRVVDGGESPELAVVLCHGFGAPGDDLVPLAMEMASLDPALGEGVRFVFPEAPLSLGPLGWPGARAWWMVDVERFAAATSPEALRQLTEEVPPGLDGARRALRAAVEGVAARTGLPLGRIVLGGFSQGSMVATDLALRLEEAPAALIVFSGTLICAPEWRRLAGRRAGLPVLQAHGRQDPLLPYGNAEALRDVLAGSGLPVDFIPFDGGHTIGMEALERASHLVGGLRANAGS